MDGLSRYKEAKETYAVDPKCCPVLVLAYGWVENRVWSVNTSPKVFFDSRKDVSSDTEVGNEWLLKRANIAQDRLYLGSRPATFQPLQNHLTVISYSDFGGCSV